MIRGKGLLNAVVMEPNNGKTATDFCLGLAKRGLLAKPTHDHTVRLAPPLTISDAEIQESLSIIEDALRDYEM